MDCEGIVSKKISSRYVSGRSKAWLKVKCFADAEFTVIGWELANRGPATVLLARETSDGLEFAVSAFVTLAADERDRFWSAMKRLASAAPPLTLPGYRSALWVRPDLRVAAKFLKGEERLRHATFRGCSRAPARRLVSVRGKIYVPIAGGKTERSAGRTAGAARRTRLQPQ
jgi:ATP-dependent DNA ligase